MIVRAKFRVHYTEQWKNNAGEISSEVVKMSPVYSDDLNSENHQFWQATPSGDLAIYITNPSAIGMFKQGEEYYVDFTPANK